MTIAAGIGNPELTESTERGNRLRSGHSTPFELCNFHLQIREGNISLERLGTNHQSFNLRIAGRKRIARSIEYRAM
jgi:hypothetical protein